MPENQREHLYLKNEVGESRVFHLERGMDDSTEDTDRDRHYRSQKDRLHENFQTFQHEREIRHQNRTIELPAHIDYVEIAFFEIFNSDLANKFERNFGLKVVSFSNFNQDVIFAISDNRRFRENFVRLLNLFYNSQGDVLPNECKLLTLIDRFHCLTTERIAPYRCSENVILHFVDNSLIPRDFEIIKNELISFMRERNINYVEIAPDSLFQIASIPLDLLKTLIDNFDIIQKVQSLRTLHIRPNAVGDPELVVGLNVDVEPNVPIIGIIDTGISSIGFMQEIICDSGLDLTNPDNPQPYSIETDHGTTVATLASFGWDYFNNPSEDLRADARVFSIKAQSGETSVINLFKIVNAIKRANQEYGIRIFNLSLNVGGKEYNSEISEYAYLLDELAYNNDILIFISTGNLPIEDINEIGRVRQDAFTDPATRNFLTYPNHFYNPNKISEAHLCVFSNLCEPSESMNNITVGALADNLVDERDLTDLSLSKNHPAFYTRKYHIDHTKTINNTRFKKNQINKNLFKPDIMMPGGDVVSDRSKMQVIGVDSGNLHYKRSSGTSYATPLAANLASKIVKKYPEIKMQTVKALMINSSTSLQSGYLDNLIQDLKQECSLQPLELLSRSEKSALSKKYSAERLNSFISGHGTPDITKCLFSNEKMVTLVIEDSIFYDSHKVINLNIPHYLYEHTKSIALKITATLCYKFDPVLDNPLAYNPVHISFNIGNSILKNDHNGNAMKYAECRKNRDNDRIAIKSNFFSWSDDFYPASSKLFSNVQKFSENISALELQKVEGQISIIVRCTGRHDATLSARVQKEHEFSLVFCIEETYCEELEDKDLYSEISLVNTLEAIAEARADAEIEN